ncbi:MAG: UDP-2,3-diacylglucosamine diphosphatase [Thermoanaerobaculia bacterium]|nr:UDP-2,3-diacylglucosamine diphosphatase [Thermoanaerobaculia bacterium]
MIEKDSIIVIGDSHIGLGDGAEKRIVAWLDKLERTEPRALYLNGDVFHYFIGDEKFHTNAVRNFLGKLNEMKRSGIDVFYIEGNRDFFVRGSYAEPAVTRVTSRESFFAGDRRFFLTHGDMINDRDYPYRFWRSVSKNAITRFAVKLWPEKPARRFVENVERKLSKTNFKHKRRLPTELMQHYGHKRAAEGYDVTVFGHFHHKLLLESNGSTVVVLPAWYESEEAMVISPTTGEFDFATVE